MRLVFVLLLAACGRIGFDATPTGDGGTGDGMQQGDGGPVVGSPSFVTAVEGSSASAVVLNIEVPGVQTGDVIVVFVGWRSGTNQAIGITDTNANNYAAQGQVTRSNNMVSQQTFTANVTTAIAPTQLTVTMTVAAPSLSARVVVYRGVTIFGNGSGQAQTANATTPVSPFVAGAIAIGSNTALATSTSPCSGCTLRMTTAFGDMVVERVYPTAGGIQSISVALDGSAAWVMGHIQLLPQ
jgi:hypothetical protein